MLYFEQLYIFVIYILDKKKENQHLVNNAAGFLAKKTGTKSVKKVTHIFDRNHSQRS